METTFEKIEKWENLEIERSASEAAKKQGLTDLRIKDEILQRYFNPPIETPYFLEYSYHTLGDVKDQLVLDYGCGSGDDSIMIANRGGNVIGVDISPDLILLAEKRLKAHNLADKAEFRVGSAHDLPLEDESVDVVFGMAILHHLDLDLASKEVFRVLKKGGRAIFQEPVRNSKVIKFIRGLIPFENGDVSPYERPLTDAELEEFAEEFSTYKSRAFSLPFVNLIEVLGLPESMYHSSVKVDRTLLNSLSFLNYYASVKVIEMTK